MRTSLALVLLCSPLAAQSFNIDVGSNLIIFPVPSAAYGAAAAQPGTWNDVHTPYSATLTNLDGTPSSVSVSSTSTTAYNWPFGPLVGDDHFLMADVQDLPNIGGPFTWTFSGLASGDYRLFTYAYDPSGSSVQTFVDVASSSDPLQNVGGLWTGSPHVLGVTYALHHVSVTSVTSGTITLTCDGVAGAGSINGFQLVRDSGPGGFCFGDGTGAPCPCANNGAPGHGCANSIIAAGGRLQVGGASSIASDTLVLVGDGMPNAAALYFQGVAQVGGGAGVAFGDGLRCAGGTTVRLGTKTNVAGTSSYPTGGDLAISVRGGCVVGDVRHYQTWYRNAAAFCTPNTFNLTNGVTVTWSL